MTKYIVHIYREMRLTFEGIEADTPDAAAAIARDKQTGDADDIADCDGETFAAWVDVTGYEYASLSVKIDFEPERQRKATPTLLAALIQAEVLIAADIIRDDAGCLDNIRAAIAEAKAAGITPAPGDIDVHALLAERRQIAHIWSIEDVQQLRPDLDDDQAWKVLQDVDRHKDAELGITWLTLEMAAEHLFGNAPKTDEAAEEQP